jgi:predicted MFS family arabinose efflux permease
MIGLEAPAIVQATVFGVGSSGIALGFGLGPLLGGIVASVAGIRAGLIVAAALALVLAALVGLRAREPRPHQPI